ncbi:hypothetical protein JJJ17_13910 [Paracoccus caeni]|uniref:Uncharacterized protein n=1 Tax=Paracoccus caeni TaxID=657651 RepID=A0A934SKN2_9RHOB|nr:hypothetical protein [Paracoccus caeni]MBK4217027.1 hypothetical protein [Paracoccus caeni]
MKMRLTYEKWRQERANLIKSIEVANLANPGSLIAIAFQRALTWIEEHPAAKRQSPVAQLAYAQVSVRNKGL